MVRKMMMVKKVKEKKKREKRWMRNSNNVLCRNSTYSINFKCNNNRWKWMTKEITEKKWKANSNSISDEHVF
tara:strand:+ start:1604 stop:1819 length:216 start_codon:yes stop_codon:yes gene_type:complete